MTDPKVVITITASDHFGTVESRRELPAHRPTEVLREQIAKAAAEAASHVSDLIDTHVSIEKAIR